MRWPSPLAGQLRQRLGEQPVKFVFLATEHPEIPDIEILDKRPFRQHQSHGPSRLDGCADFPMAHLTVCRETLRNAAG